MMRKFLFAAVMVGLLAACGGGKSYQMSAHDVTAKLLATKPPMFAFGETASEVMVTQGAGGAVRWTILKAGRQMMRLVATVTPEGEGASRVSVAIEPPNNDASSTIARNMAENPAITKLYVATMEEQIDAKLNDRDFNMSAIQGQMMAAALATMPKIADQMDEAAKRSRDIEADMDKARVDAAYERDHREAMNGYNPDDNTNN